MSKIEKMAIACLDEMYRASAPPITWKEIMSRYADTGIPFFMNHVIREGDYKRIRDKYRKKFPLYLRRSFDMFLLDYSPSVKEWRENEKK